MDDNRRAAQADTRMKLLSEQQSSKFILFSSHGCRAAQVDTGAKLLPKQRSARYDIELERLIRDDKRHRAQRDFGYF